VEKSHCFPFFSPVVTFENEKHKFLCCFSPFFPFGGGYMGFCCLLFLFQAQTTKAFAFFHHLIHENVGNQRNFSANHDIPFAPFFLRSHLVVLSFFPIVHSQEP
jgi:hypothetical protein